MGTGEVQAFLTHLALGEYISASTQNQTLSALLFLYRNVLSQALGPDDSVRVRHGHDLAIGGGIDKRAVAIGGETMQREVDRVMPLVEDGGYLPELDHTVPPDISWQKFGEYMQYLVHRLGRG